MATSAGSHHAGQDRAPQALRNAGLLDRLRAAGLSVDDCGDVVTEVFVVDHAEPIRRNFDAVVRVRADPAGCAAVALQALRAASDGFILHFDVDAVDSGDLPLANFPHYGSGVTLEQAGRVLSVVAAAPELSAIVLTEVNPSHDPGGHQMHRYVTTVADALAAALRPAGNPSV